MKAIITEKNINLISPGIIPQIFDKYFFIKNKILQEEQILPHSVFGDLNRTIYSENYRILIGIGKLIIVAAHSDSFEDKINKVVEMIINAANLTDVSLGFNFDWKFFLEGGQTPEKISKALFYNDKNPVHSKYFNVDDAAFGFYASKNFKNSRLRLDVRPISLLPLGSGASVQDKKHVLQFQFSFQENISADNSVPESIQALNNFDDYFKETINIISLYE